MGSGVLIGSLMAADLIDEYLLMIHPLVLGTGRRLFPAGVHVPLRLTGSVTSATGVVIATYEPGERLRRGTKARRLKGLQESTMKMKQYLLSIYQPDGDPPPPAVLAGIMRDVVAVDQELRSAGAWVFSGGLHAPSTATVIRPGQQEAPMTDGPYVEGKEHIGSSDHHQGGQPR